jgi:CRISPR/Cas system CMR subunit Cmr4 (Cas7 group RAMP superfamily)
MSNDRIQIEYSLTFTTPFHFGTGLREGVIDRSVRRNANGYLYVPGSTLKGVIREHCEQICRLLEPDNQRIASPHNQEDALLDLYDPATITLITHIFGSPGQPGLLFFDNAQQSEADLQIYESIEKSESRGRYKNVQTGIYTQVRLDRPTRTAIQGALYTSEFGRSDTSFIGSIGGWLPHTSIKGLEDVSQEMLLLLAGLMMVERLGGNKSTGKGACRNEIMAIEINGADTGKQEVWARWLDQLEQLVVSGGA